MWRFKPHLVGIAASLLLLLLPLQSWLPIELSWLETFAVVSYAWSVWLLALNNPLGWWVGLIGTALYGVVFSRQGFMPRSAFRSFT